MNTTSVTTWIKNNKIITLSIGLAIVGAAVYFSRRSTKKGQLSGCHRKRKPLKARKQVALVGLN